jgi:hypothetical protein
VAGIVSGALALMWIAEAAVNCVRRKLWEHQRRKLLRSFLLTLSQEEADLLESMSRHNQQSLTGPLEDPITNRLVQKKLLARASGAGRASAWTYTVPPEVWTEIKRRWP